MKRTTCTLILMAIVCCAAACDEDDPRCDGTPNPCTISCSNDGCFGGYSCTGSSWECSSAYSQWECDNAGSYYGACNWTWACYGAPTPCDEFDSGGECRAQLGCKWED